MVNNSESYNANSEEENCITVVSDSMWSKVDYAKTGDLFNWNTGINKLPDVLDNFAEGVSVSIGDDVIQTIQYNDICITNKFLKNENLL